MPFRKLFLTGATVLALGAFSSNGFASQNLQTTNPTPDKALNPQATQNLDVVQKVIAVAEQHYNLGARQFNNGEYALARVEFDRAVDTLLEAGVEVRKDNRFHTYYLELVEKVYKHQVAAVQSGKEGFS